MEGTKTPITIITFFHTENALYKYVHNQNVIFETYSYDQISDQQVQNHQTSLEDHRMLYRKLLMTRDMTA